MIQEKTPFDLELSGLFLWGHYHLQYSILMSPYSRTPVFAINMEALYEMEPDVLKSKLNQLTESSIEIDFTDERLLPNGILHAAKQLQLEHLVIAVPSKLIYSETKMDESINDTALLSDPETVFRFAKTPGQAITEIANERSKISGRGILITSHAPRSVLKH